MTPAEHHCRVYVGVADAERQPIRVYRIDEMVVTIL